MTRRSKPDKQCLVAGGYASGRKASPIEKIGPTHCQKPKSMVYSGREAGVNMTTIFLPKREPHHGCLGTSVPKHWKSDGRLDVNTLQKEEN